VGPSLVNVVGESLIGFDLVALMGIVHSIFGVAAVILGIWLVGWLKCGLMFSQAKLAIVREKRS
jgi:hypothetical protein